MLMCCVGTPEVFYSSPVVGISCFCMPKSKPLHVVHRLRALRALSTALSSPCILSATPQVYMPRHAANCQQPSLACNGPARSEIQHAPPPATMGTPRHPWQLVFPTTSGRHKVAIVTNVRCNSACCMLALAVALFLYASPLLFAADVQSCTCLHAWVLVINHQQQ